MSSFTIVILAGVLGGTCREVSPSGNKDFTSIQQAIDASVSGDRIVVWPGTYYENVSFRGKAVEVMSASGSSQTIIDGRYRGAVVVFAAGEGPGAVLNGFTIRSGSGYSRPGRTATTGGGIAIISASPTVRNNLVVSSRADLGGGIGVVFGEGAQIINNRVEYNTAVEQGGGIGVLMANPTITVNHIASNTVSSTKGEGGGVFLGFTDHPVFTHNVVAMNSAAHGSGVYVDYVSQMLYFDRNTVADNCSPQGGAGLEMFSQTPHVNIRVRYSILWNNQMSCSSSYYNYYYYANDFHNLSTAYMSYSDTSEYNGSTNGNVSQYPYFVYPRYDYHLSSYSPVYWMGPSSFYKASTGLPKFIRGDADSNGQITQSDVNTIWAYYSQGTPVQCVQALDVNDDGYIDVSDVTYLSYYINGYYGPPPAPFPGCGIDACSPFSCNQHYCQ